jgi:hypothetical protein
VVHVFLPIDVKTNVVEKALQEKMPSLQVTVFGRFRDFEDGITNGKPDAVLSIRPVLEQHGKQVTLQGQRGGKGQEPYVIASINTVLVGALVGKTIGVVDFLGREQTQSFLGGLLMTRELKVKRVAKVEDLLPLLEFSAADGIVLPAVMLTRMMERTRLSLKSREVPGGMVGLPAVAILNPLMKDVVAKVFKEMDSETKTLLGIDAWSVR